MKEEIYRHFLVLVRKQRLDLFTIHLEMDQLWQA